MAAAEHSPGPTRPSLALVGALAAGLMILVALNAWLCDDAFITLRSAKNLVEGRGPVFNAPWRVQSFTHPAWMLLLAGAWALTREAFFTSLALSLGVSALVVFGALRTSVSGAAALSCAAALACSRAFLEYSSSGLENPLTHLVVVAGAWLCLRLAQSSELGGHDEPGEHEHEHERVAELHLRAAGLLVSAAFLSRPDALLLLAPLFVAAERAATRAGLGRGRRALACLLGAAPALAWESFSLFYYGALVPNTALAKLGLGLERGELVARGLAYVWHTVSSDPSSALVLLVGLALPWAPRRWLARAGLGCGASSSAALRPLARGALAYLVFVVAIGGDFMEGRFLSAPILCAALAFARLSWAPRRGLLALLWTLVLVVLAGAGARHPWLPDAGEGKPRVSAGVADERSHYAAAASLAAWRPGRDMPEHRWRELGRAGPEPVAGARTRVAQFSTMGFYGFYADPSVHVVDGFALADPLLAHLPPLRRINWKPGHAPRALPAGYLDTLRGDPWDLRIEDPRVAELYGVVARVHLGPLLAAGRGAAIWALLSGRASAQLDARAHYLAELERVDLRRLERRSRALRFRDAGVELALERGREAVSLSLSPGQDYALIYSQAGREVGREQLELPGAVDAELVPVALSLPAAPIDRIHVFPLTMRGRRSLEISASSHAGEGAS